ncbi:MAG: virulence RhuM family protein [Bacilli bacterium]|nr:virulence RhuM family protein [Bacilli bacterium]
MKKKSEILIYNLPDGSSNVEVLLNEEDIWMTQTALSQLFQTSTQNITMHIKNIYEEGELEESRTCKFDLQVQTEGNRTVKRNIKIYNLEMIIAIGFRAKSSVGNSFRIWANKVLNDFMKKGFVLDDKRLEDPSKFGHDYFDELLSRIKAIRASEKRLYQKILEIYSTSIDYNQKDEESLLFFKTVQNKLHYAISGETAAELIYHRSDSTKDNMGLTSWSGNRVQKVDVTVAKNYLSKEELDSLNQIVNMYLDHAERMAKSNIPMHMSDWKEALDEFLKFERADILEGPGKISHKLAEQKALKEYEKYDLARQNQIEKEIDSKLLDILKENK